MKGHILHAVYALLALLIPSSMVIAEPIPGLFNTGQGIAPGVQDTNYASGAGSFVVNPHADGVWSWLGSVGSLPPNTQWVSQQHVGATALTALDNTAFNYSLSFNLAGLDPLSAVINYRFAVDNNLEVRLNGSLVGSLIGGGAADATTFNSLHDGITINSALLAGLGTSFLSGLNTLEFRVLNLAAVDNPEGLLVAISGSANPLGQIGPPVISPEPESLVLWVLLVGMMLTFEGCRHVGLGTKRTILVHS